MSPDTPGEDDDAVTPKGLRGVIEDLRTDAMDAPETLKRVWCGLVQARLLGLRLAADDRYRKLQVNAESVEHQLARDLGTSAAFAGEPLALPTPPTAAPLPPEQAQEAVDALVEFSATARRAMLAAAPSATQWDDERVLRHDSKVMGELGAAWLGQRTSYRLDR
ncbi:hypothetical protein GCM10010492_31990 [Saccharothrix mutabilis subsp. mutabilis]|uniref:Uncharacterized protein n=1 Tax=Saccharothrix mutabilis subsp. mutabilis TaxID=66855 RepID=A0ABN0TVQ2_9PSEU